VLLAWDPNSETNLAGYKVYFGMASGVYNAPNIIGTETTYTVNGLGPGTWYFAVTAYNTEGLESGYSNEVSTTIAGAQLSITTQVASLRWFGVVVLATTDRQASAIFRYRKLVDGAQWSTIIATPTPFKTEHRVVLYLPSGSGTYAYEWTMTSASSVVATGIGTFVR